MDGFWMLARENALAAIIVIQFGVWVWTVRVFLAHLERERAFVRELNKIWTVQHRQIQEALEVNRALAEQHATTIRDHHGLLERCLDHIKALPERVATMCRSLG